MKWDKVKEVVAKEIDNRVDGEVNFTNKLFSVGDVFYGRFAKIVIGKQTGNRYDKFIVWTNNDKIASVTLLTENENFRSAGII